ncbi:histidine triad (HIT) family protein [Naumannella cuiyingiana]|uniref:Histidine triad (HIT) family protein n=1 Tax=Naumannella cuiyingiana TaxID=1347891 RepID=A0A7Z0DBG1_9ACTN|nr:HIT domain-containing protein [Naumannella cuiyingiana]NYI72452.1 histidine triad (HIT) family protein [Naumannella cuiyingiana]
MATQDPDCLFCKIIAGEIPSRQVYADDAAIAFLDINPFHRGHTLVVPREHAPDLLAGDAGLGEIAPAVDATARLLRDRLQPAGMNIFSSAGPVAGQEIFHTHVHLIPRYAERPGLRGLFDRDLAAGDDLDIVHAELTA